MISAITLKFLKEVKKTYDKTREKMITDSVLKREFLNRSDDVLAANTTVAVV